MDSMRDEFFLLLPTNILIIQTATPEKLSNLRKSDERRHGIHFHSISSQKEELILSVHIE